MTAPSTRTPRIPRRSSRRSSRCGRRPARRTCWSSCSTTSASAARARSAARAGPRRPSAWPADGLKFTRFHTTALCSPTRAALLSGRNHHSVGMGGITEIATSAPGYNSIRPNTCAPLAETLKLNGYATAQFGKCHEVPVWETSPIGPFDAWPTGGGGFEYFYGFIGGETNQYYPAHLRGHDAGRARQDAGGGLPLHRGHDRQGDRLGPPAEGAHAATSRSSCTSRRARRTRRTTCRRSGRTKYKGRFDQGWDALREETFARQKELGVIPPEAELTAATRGDPRLGRDPGRPEAGPRAPDGGLRRLPRAHRPPRRAAGRRARGPRRPRRHARLLHHRRQRRERRRRRSTAASTS